MTTLATVQERLRKSFDIKLPQNCYTAVSQVQLAAFELPNRMNLM